MKLFYLLTFIVAALLFSLGAYLRTGVPLPSFGTDVLLGSGLLLAFAAFAGTLLEGKESLESI